VPHHVVVAGCIGIDTNVYLAGADVDFTVEASFTENVDCVGQAGGYSARGFARLGFATAFIGSVGRDFQGEEIRRCLASEGIETLLFDDPIGTHRSVNVMYRDGRRKSFYDGKGQGEVVPDLAACETLLEGARVLHVHLEDWCRCLPEMARRHGVVVSCDLQDLTALDDPYRRDFIEGSDILFFSCVNFPEPEAAVRALLAGRTGRIVIGGRGAGGVVVGTAAGIERLPALDLPEPVVDTNGAGDSLAAGFLASHLLDGLDLARSVRRGQLAARRACAQRAGAKVLTSRADLESLDPR